MDKLRVGIIVNQYFKRHIGGGYSYYNILLQAINNFEFSPEIEIINIVIDKDETPFLNLKKRCIYIRERFSMARTTKLHSLCSALLRRYYKRKVEDTLRKQKIDLIYYLSPIYNTVYNYPFIATNWDVGHRSTFSFPEISMGINYETRENYYSYILNQAMIIICESEAGVNELNTYYKFLNQKVKVLPLFAGSMVNLTIEADEQERILLKYDLESDGFFVYPAQFWSHKNHYNLLKAFYKFQVSKNFRKMKLVLCGSDKGNLKYIKEVINFLKLDETVILPGFVSDEELHVFYTHARALVMPTFLGPTNLPIIEAPHMRCPVLCSDMEGHQEILGDHALYFDPQNTESIKVVMEMIMDDELKYDISSKAYEHIKKSPFNIENSLVVLNKILDEAKAIRKTWGGY